MSDIYTEVLKEIEKQNWYCFFKNFTFKPDKNMVKNTLYLTDGRMIDFYLSNSVIEIANEMYGERESYRIIARNIVEYFDETLKENENELQRISKDDLF